MATGKKSTPKGEERTPIAIEGNPWWHLLKSATGFRHAAQCSADARTEDEAMAEHLQLMWRDADYRAAVLGGIERRLDGKPEGRPVSLNNRQASDFLEYVHAALIQWEDDPREATEAMLTALFVFDPLILGDVVPPKLTEVMIDQVEREVRIAIGREKTWRGQREKATAVARAVLRAVGVPDQRARDLYR